MRVVWRILTVILVVALLGVSTAMVAVRLNHGQFLSVQSGSMVPQLQRGDLIMVKRVPVSGIQIGDVITFTNPKDPRQVITHRVVGTPAELGAGNFQTKGDANLSPDSFIPASAIIGRASYAIPYMGAVADFIKRPVGLALLVYIPALLFIFGELRRLIRHYREREASYTMFGYDHHRPHHAHHFFRNPFSHAKLFIGAFILSMLYLRPVHAAAPRQATLANNHIETITLR